MTGRKCSTCKHYDPAPVKRKGWCRNPLLYSPQQSHLVGDDTLDCERGVGNYWESADSVASGSVSSSHRLPLVLDREPLTPYQPGSTLPQQAPLRVYPVTGSSGYRDDPPIDESGDERLATPGGSGRQIEYYSEERYWTDYLRIILPILGVLLFLVLLYLWALAFLRGDDENPGQGGVVATSTIPMITAEATGTLAAGVTGTPSGPSIILTPEPLSTNPPQTGSTPIPTEIVPVGPSEDIFIGAVVMVANTAGEGLRLRADPSVDSEQLTVLLDGAQLDVIDGPQETAEFVWWNVTNGEFTGWVVADYLEVVE